MKKSVYKSLKGNWWCFYILCLCLPIAGDISIASDPHGTVDHLCEGGEGGGGDWLMTDEDHVLNIN